MPPKAPLPSAAAWKCPQCTVRSFSTSSRWMAVGPEHPKYIDVPEPPQQTAPYRPPVKGVLPVPRDVFAGIDRSRTDDQIIADSTQSPTRAKTPAKGSREEWNAKMSEVRKRNLREGVQSLRARQQVQQRTASERQAQKYREREELLHRPERDDERLTAPSNNFDVKALLGRNPVPDPTREQRILAKMENLERHAGQKREERMSALHDLYMNARDFIVTPEQLDAALDKAFGTPENPVTFGTPMYAGDQTSGRSIWAKGRPERISDLLHRSQGGRGATSTDGATDQIHLNAERIRRIAEALTGGKMDTEVR
ncbi:Hypothetical predicted protein [Lecanosticta acicola]|uniref:Uncharacterized protein n=1 Tax=Lecanosticta acicola TaxID=111012 RepID=A0AAI8YUY5_9PEZI|nr:Hypothetical predicted protein [Lecanosticta acicola]